jgi:hypothetical protein
MSDPLVGPDDVRVLARAARLPLGEERLALVADLLNAWLPAAGELSLAMSAAELRTTVPVTVFAHPAPDGTEQLT